MYPSEIVAEVQALLKDAATTELATADRVMRVANTIYVEMGNRIGRVSKDFFKVSEDLSVVSGTAEYTLHPRLLSLRAVEDAGGEMRTQLRTFRDVVDEIQGWTVRAGKLVLSPTPTTGETWTLHYDRRPPMMTYGVCQTTYATTTVVMEADSSTTQYGRTSKVDDYYNGANVAIYSGTASVSSREVTDYVGSTRVCTVAAGTLVDATSLYAIESEIPDDFMDALCWLTAARISALDKDNDGWMTLERVGTKMYKTALFAFTGRVRGRAKTFRSGRRETV